MSSSIDQICQIFSANLNLSDPKHPKETTTKRNAASSRLLRLPLELRWRIVDLVLQNPDYLNTHVVRQLAKNLESSDCWKYYEVSLDRHELILKKPLSGQPCFYVDPGRTEHVCVEKPAPGSMQATEPLFRPAPRTHTNILRSCRQIAFEMQGRPIAPQHHVYSFRERGMMHRFLSTMWFTSDDLQASIRYFGASWPWGFPSLSEVRAVCVTFPPSDDDLDELVPMNYAGNPADTDPSKGLPRFEIVYIPAKALMKADRNCKIEELQNWKRAWSQIAGKVYLLED